MPENWSIARCEIISSRPDESSAEDEARYSVEGFRYIESDEAIKGSLGFIVLEDSCLHLLGEHTLRVYFAWDGQGEAPTVQEAQLAWTVALNAFGNNLELSVMARVGDQEFLAGWENKVVSKQGQIVCPVETSDATVYADIDCMYAVYCPEQDAARARGMVEIAIRLANLR